MVNLLLLTADTPPVGISATCISNSSDSLTVAVSYINGCRRKTTVEANGTECTSVMKSPRMAVFQCDGLEPSISYNIRVMDSDGHVDSLTCSTADDNRGELKLLKSTIRTICTIHCGHFSNLHTHNSYYHFYSSDSSSSEKTSASTKGAANCKHAGVQFPWDIRTIVL